MGPLSSILNSFFTKAESHSLEHKPLLRFDKIVKGIEVPRASEDCWYHGEDFDKFKADVKSSTKNSLHPKILGLSESSKNEPSVNLITRIFSRTFEYLQSFIIPSALEPDLESEEDLPSIELPQRILTPRLENAPWMIVPYFIQTKDAPGTNWTLVVKGCLGTIPEEPNESKDMKANTITNSKVSKATAAIQKAFRRKRALKALEQSLEPSQV